MPFFLLASPHNQCYSFNYPLNIDVFKSVSLLSSNRLTQ